MKAFKNFGMAILSFMLFMVSCNDSAIEQPEPANSPDEKEAATHWTCDGTSPCYDCYDYVQCRMDGTLQGWWGHIDQKRANRSYPYVGSIVVLYGNGYDSYYGHMAIVSGYNSSYIYVDEGNWNGGCSTGRAIARTDSRIQGYYVQ